MSFFQKLLDIKKEDLLLETQIKKQPVRVLIAEVVGLILLILIVTAHGCSGYFDFLQLAEDNLKEPTQVSEQ